MPPATDDEVLRFNRFEISAGLRELRVDGQPVAVGARAFDLLLALAQRRERLVSKQELLDLVWADVVVEEHNIAAHISTLRKLLGAGAIATVPGRGYRLTALGAGATPDDARRLAPSALPLTGIAQSNLPRELTPLFGREDDLATLATHLQRHRLVTLVGAGGIGKSLLAQHLLSGHAGDYAHGVCWVELASLSDAAALPQCLAEALDVRPGTGEPLQGLCTAVAGLKVLVALDNAEHLVADVARAAAALLEVAPGLRLLVTSQVPLRLAAEHVYRVGPLAVPQRDLPATLAQTFSAVALFVERARAADARFVLSDDDAPAAIELCRRLDGLPLAIELAAARAGLLGVRRLAASMQDRLKVLTRNRDAAAPARQQTLRAALEWSHGLLDEHERTVFRRLSVMADSASLDFVQQVIADERGPLDRWAVLDALGTLVDRSLVAVLTDEDRGSHGPPEAYEPRYRLLESPRLFAIEELRTAGEDDLLRRRHATALAQAFDAAWDERWSGSIGARQWASRILPDASQARDAIRWACTAGEADITVAIAATLIKALPWASAHAERIALADVCESLVQQVASPLLKLRALEIAVRPMAHRQQQLSLALAANAVTLAREIDRKAPDRWLLYQALGLWIQAAAVVSDPSPDALRDALAELAALEDPGWPAQRLTRGLEAMCWARVALGGPDLPAEQLSLTRRLVEGFEAEGAYGAPAMMMLIDAELFCGHTQAAVQLGERLLEQLAATRDEFSRMLVRINLDLALLALDDTVRARRVLQAVWPAARQFDLCALCSDHPALLACLEGRPHAAARLAGYADAAHAARGLFRQPNEAAARERCHTLAREALGIATFERLLAAGGHLRDDQIAELAFAVEDSA